MRADLAAQARRFCSDVNDLLNHTITDGPRLRAVLRKDGRIGWMGYGIDEDEPFPGRGVPLAIGRARPRCFLHVMHTLALDAQQRYLTVTTSTYGLHLEADLSGPVFHYDYEREASTPYPEAHVQVLGRSEALEELGRRIASELALDRLHFPVGGRRYRPSLEDIVEFLVVEGLAEAKGGWREAVGRHRAEYHRLQLRAAVRRDPAAARAELEELGYRVRAPAST